MPPESKRRRAVRDASEQHLGHRMVHEILVHRSRLVRVGRIGVLGAPAAAGPCMTHVLYEPVLRQFPPMAVDVITNRVGTAGPEPLGPRPGGRGGGGTDSNNPGRDWRIGRSPPPLRRQ
jgi:hypothetical protein